MPDETRENSTSTSADSAVTRPSAVAPDELKRLAGSPLPSDLAPLPPKSVVDDLKWWEDRYVSLTAKLGDVTRQLAFAGVAAIWVVGKIESSNPELPFQLALAALFFLLGFAADLLQAVFAVVDAGHVGGKLREGDISVLETENLPWHLRALDTAPRLFFWLKLGLIGAGYVPLLLHVGRVLSVT